MNGMRRIVARAEHKWGTAAQFGMVSEEAGELIAAVNQYQRSRITAAELAGEVADMEIMIDFIRLAIGDDLVDGARAVKLARLEERVARD